MEKLNLPPFTVGQKVVCVDPGTNKPLKKGDKYTITSIHNNCRCGYLVNVDNHTAIGLDYRPILNGELCACGGCGTLKYSNGFSLYLPTRFASIQESKFRAVSFEKVMEENKVLCEN